MRVAKWLIFMFKFIVVIVLLLSIVFGLVLFANVALNIAQELFSGRRDVSSWVNPSAKPFWLVQYSSGRFDFESVPSECTELGFNAFVPLQTIGVESFGGYCADFVCSNGTLVVDSKHSAHCEDLKNYCSFGVFDAGTGLCEMRECLSDSDCGSGEMCKSFGKGVYVVGTGEIVPSTMVCSEIVVRAL